MARCWLLASDRAARESPHKAADYQLLVTSVSAPVTGLQKLL